MKQNRPVNLDLRTVRFPLPAIVSILHRASGVVLFLLIPLLLWMLQMSLSSPWTFTKLKDLMAYPLMKIVVFGLLASLIYHLIAGVRHLFMDAHIGDSKEGGRRGAKWVLALSIVLTLVVGVWLW
ncbi:MAG: succinate dehydrogenase, cytochrome b556 subunit [Gammaproteobacteria bacterium]